jgi:N-acetylglucosamine-6-phosphate deacetylase
MTDTYAIEGGKIITPFRILENHTLIVEGKKIKSILGSSEDLPSGCRTVDAEGAWITPGFVDMHVHGGGGFDAASGETDQLIGMAEFHLSHGTTSITPALAQISSQDQYRFLDLYRKALPNRKGGTILGFHLEGPFVNPKQAGAMKPGIIGSPAPEDAEKILFFRDIVKTVTMAPEIAGCLELARRLRGSGIRLAIGHSDGLIEDGLNALESGFTHITHLYSALTMTRRINAYRHGGLVETAYLMDPFTVELIADGKHLPQELLRLAYRTKGPDKIALVTDANRAAGSPEGPAKGTGGRDIIVEDGVAKLPDRSAFAGSIATMDRLVKNMVCLAGAPVEEAVRMASFTPARILGVSNRKGILSAGMDADIVIMDEDFSIRAVFVEGELRRGK